MSVNGAGFGRVPLLLAIDWNGLLTEVIVVPLLKCDINGGRRLPLPVEMLDVYCAGSPRASKVVGRDRCITSALARDTSTALSRDISVYSPSLSSDTVIAE